MTHCFLRFSVIILIITTVQLSQARSSTCCDDYCYSLDPDRTQSKHFATKTAYEVVRGSSTSQEHVVRHCRPSKFWMLVRHGTRLPGKSDIESMPPILNDLRDTILENYAHQISPKRGLMCAQDLDLFKQWQWDKNITVQYESFLTDQGWDDLKSLAMREKDRFSEVFDGSYAEQRYLFRHTKTQRTEASFKAFAEGLFGEESLDSISTEPGPNDDVLLKPYDFCPAYTANKEKIKDPDSELSKFVRSPLYTQTLADISTRLGFQDVLTTDQIDAMWNACRFEQAWNLRQPSPWCSVFTKTHVNVIEYKEDLNYYYQNSYGYAMGSNLSCHAMADMMKHMGREDGEQVVGYFTHESAIQIFLVALGATKDTEDLRADNYYSMRQRQFVSSDLAPFAANVAVVRYECDDPVEPTKLKFFLNEKTLKFGWCNRGLCNWSEVAYQYRRFLDGNCDEMYCG